MGVHVSCACGNAIECDRLDLVVELSCPVCKKPLTLEYTGPGRQRYMALLRIMEGPRLVGDTFVIPVNADLILGSAEGNWLVLPEGEVASDHCRIRMDRHGQVQVFNLGSAQGTWIDNLRIVEGVLEPGHDLRIGFYRLRLEPVTATAVLNVPAPEAPSDEPVPEAAPLLVMRPVDADETPLTQIAARRFLLVRGALMGLSWSLLAFYALMLRSLAIQRIADWHEYALPSAGVVVAFALWRYGRRAALAAPRINVASLVLIALLLAVSLFMQQWVMAAGCGLLAVAAAIVTLRPTNEEHALGAAFIGGVGLITVLVPVVMATQMLLAN